MRTILLVAALAAAGCSGDPAHEVVACEGVWGGELTVKSCEQACAAGPICASGDNDCALTLTECRQPDGRAPCFDYHIAEYDGQRGCCRQELTDDGQVATFTPCEGE